MNPDFTRDLDVREVELQMADQIEIQRQDDEESFYEQMQNDIVSAAEKKASKHLKKHKTEIARLKRHAHDCVMSNNFEGYKYSILKLRKLYKIKNPGNTSIRDLWLGTRESVGFLINNA